MKITTKENSSNGQIIFVLIYSVLYCHNSNMIELISIFVGFPIGYLDFQSKDKRILTLLQLCHSLNFN